MCFRKVSRSDRSEGRVTAIIKQQLNLLFLAIQGLFIEQLLINLNSLLFPTTAPEDTDLNVRSEGMPKADQLMAQLFERVGDGDDSVQTSEQGRLAGPTC